MTSIDYSLFLEKGSKRLTLSVTANDINHAQGQALDISRSLGADRIEIDYGKTRENHLSNLYNKLAHNDFDFKECFEWDGSYTNGTPSVYAFSKRFYLRPLILGYLDICQDNTVKNTCCNTRCINPYHNHYLTGRNSKLSGGDQKIALAFRSQGVSVPQIAKALNVHRSTIYRTFKNERFPDGDQGH